MRPRAAHVRPLATVQPTQAGTDIGFPQKPSHLSPYPFDLTRAHADPPWKPPTSKETPAPRSPRAYRTSWYHVLTSRL